MLRLLMFIMVAMMLLISACVVAPYHPYGPPHARVVAPVAPVLVLPARPHHHRHWYW